jgi:MATE family multidrug resistance protein
MLGQAPVTAHLAQEYLAGLVWTILPALWFMAIRGFMSAINRPEPILWITLAAIPANALLVYLLLYGAVRPAAARPVRRGAGDLHRQLGTFLPPCGLPRTAGRSGSITCSAISGASTGN